MSDRLPGLDRLVDFLIGGGVVEIFRFLFNRKKNNAESDKVVSENWKDYALKLETRFEEVEKDYSDLRKKYFELELKYQILTLKISEETNHNNSRSPGAGNGGE